MGCMNSREEHNGADSPTESTRPLLDTDRLSGFEGGVAVVAPSVNDEERNGLHLSETQVGGGQAFQHVSGPNQPFIVSRQPVVNSGSFSRQQPGRTNGLYSSSELEVPENIVRSARGKQVVERLNEAFSWHTRFDSPTQEFLSLMDRLYMECQVHLSSLSSKGDIESKAEADVIVDRMIAVRNRWGTKLLPNSICNAFVRERIPHTVDGREFRIDCAQFFEPVPFYGSQQTDNPGELMKLFRFSVYDLSRNEVVLRYYLERSNVTQLYHVLCFTHENYRGQVYPYGSECPSYWEVRSHMVHDLQQRLKSQTPNYIKNNNFSMQQQGTGPVIIQIP